MAFGKTSSSRGGLGYSIDLDARDMKGLTRRMSEGEARRIILRSLNHAIGKAHTVSKRTLAKRRNLKTQDAAKQLRVIKATTSVLEASIRATGNPINLYDTKGTKTQTKKGVKANPGTGRRLFPGAFIAKMPSGHVGIFERIHKPGAPGSRREIRPANVGGYMLDGVMVNTSQLPIREIRLPSLSSTLVQEETTKALDAVARPAYNAELQRLFLRALQAKG